MVGNIGLLVNGDIARQKSFKIASETAKLLFINQLIDLSDFLTDLQPKNIGERKSSSGQVPPRKKHTSEKIGRKSTEPLKRSGKTKRQSNNRIHQQPAPLTCDYRH